MSTLRIKESLLKSLKYITIGLMAFIGIYIGTFFIEMIFNLGIYMGTFIRGLYRLVC